MASPRQLSIIPGCLLNIEVKEPDSTMIDHTHSSSAWKYQITNIDEIFTATHVNAAMQESVEGWLSPTHRITLPPKIKMKAGIPLEARSYAFLYPPEGLAELSQSELELYDSDDIFLDSLGEMSLELEAIKSVFLLGGFAYFDDKFKCICVNAISTNPSEQKLPFSGPFNVPTAANAYNELHKMNRTHSLKQETFREAGFESFAWVRGGEKIQFKPIVVDCDNANGALIFFREDRTAVAYAVDSSEYVDPTGNVGFISDAMANIGDATFTQKVIQPIYEIEDWKKNFQHLLVEPVDTAKLIETLEDKKTLLHMACHAVLGKEFIANVLSNTLEMSNLSYQNSFGWNPLHYACRFSPRDYSLIELLINAYPEAVLQSDPYGRYPLHIACDSDTSLDVITMLLAADTSSPKETILRKTFRFGLLPIHLACYKGAPNTIIEALLDADREGLTVITKTKCGQLPLHLAILKQLPATMVKILLDAASKVQNSDEYEDDADIHQTFEQKIPLHIACWNNSSSDIIEMLLEKDENNVTLHEPFGDLNGVRFDDIPFGRRRSMQFTESLETVAIHLAMKHGCKDVISLLLRREAKAEGYKVRSSTLYGRDTRGRTPLHIACEYTVDPQIIQLLIELDSLKETIQIDDNHGYRPLHYACEIDNTSTEIINILCDAEEYYMKRNKLYAKKRSTHAGDTERNRTPLFLAIKTGAPTAVIQRLLQPENFTSKGLDDPAMEDLAQVVENSEAIQEGVVRILADRLYFGIIALEFYANIIAIVSFIVASRQLVGNGTTTRVWPSLLVFSSGVFLSRELLQILSIGASYIGDLWSYNELLCITFLLITADHMFKLIDDPSQELKRNVLSFTGFLLAVQMMTFLRSTFLPFAKFVGGLLAIMSELVPFLIVSLLLLWSFVYSFFVSRIEECESIFMCTSWLLTNVFAYVPSEKADWLTTIFGIMVMIVLLNVVIAIVGEAWNLAAIKSTKLFWKYRLEKIADLRYIDKFQGAHFQLSNTRLMRYIDSMENVSYRNDISWTTQYHYVDMKDQYDRPAQYFGTNEANNITRSKSLQADLYWSEINAKSLGAKFTYFKKICIFFKWCCACTFYAVLIIMGILTGGFFFPSSFRSGVLSVGRGETIDTTANDQTSVPQTLTTFFAESNAPVGVVADHLSTMDVNSVIVIDNGIPIEQGNHHELISKGGIYASMSDEAK